MVAVVLGRREWWHDPGGGGEHVDELPGDSDDDDDDAPLRLQLLAASGGSNDSRSAESSESGRETVSEVAAGLPIALLEVALLPLRRHRRHGVPASAAATAAAQPLELAPRLLVRRALGMSASRRCWCWPCCWLCWLCCCC